MHEHTDTDTKSSSYDTAVVTCASIQAGDAGNIVTDDAPIAINVRTAKPETHAKTPASIKRVVAAEALAGNAIKDPTFQTTRAFPLNVNDHPLTEKLETSFGSHFPKGKNGYVADVSQLPGSEDVSVLASSLTGLIRSLAGSSSISASCVQRNGSKVWTEWPLF
jgi:metal-dependent amidase/aminoacylase/carboxypeptidase family protein